MQSANAAIDPAFIVHKLKKLLIIKKIQTGRIKKRVNCAERASLSDDDRFIESALSVIYSFV